MRIDPWCKLRSSNGASPKTRYSFFSSNVTKQLHKGFPIDDNIQKLQTMGLLKVLTKIWLGQDLTKVKKSSQLQAFDSMKLQDKVKAFDAMTPEDKLKVLDELLVFYEQLKMVNLDYYSLEDLNEVRFQKESIIQSIYINDINLESM